MIRRLPPLSALRAFEAAARLRSFKSAAQELSVTATAISHRIRVLEEELDRPLFLRKARAVELTGDGQALFAAVHSGFQVIAQAIEQLRRPRQASVTLSVTPAFATKWLVPRIPLFQASHPGIDLHVHASNLPVDLNSGLVDLAIRYGQGVGHGMTAQPFLQDSFAPVANPALVKAMGSDPASWPLIHFDWHRTLPIELTWGAWMVKAGYPAASVTGGIRYSEESHAIQAAVAGQGVALLSLVLVEEELRLKLLHPLTDVRLMGLTYHLVKPALRPMSAAAATVESWLMGMVQRVP